MIKLNDTTTATLNASNVLGEAELEQVVGGHRHGGYKRRDRGYGYGHCGGRRDNDKYGRGSDSDKGGYRDSSDDRGSDESSGSFEVNNQAISLDITINQVAV